MDILIALVLFTLAGFAIHRWLEKRKEPKPFSPGEGVDQALWDAHIEDLMRNTKPQLIQIWSNEIIADGGTYVPPTLGDGMTKLQIAEEICIIRFGGRP